MGMNVLQPLHRHQLIESLHSALKPLDKTSRNVSEMDSIGKSIISVDRFIKLPFMPEVPSSYRIFIADTKVALDMIGGYKALWSAKKLTECDEVGRPYWETHKVTATADHVLTISSHLIGTFRYLAHLSSFAVPTYLNLSKVALTSAAYFCRFYNDRSAIENLTAKLIKQEAKLLNAMANKEDLSRKEALIQKYSSGKDSGNQAIKTEKQAIKSLIEKLETPGDAEIDLPTVQKEAAGHLSTLSKTSAKFERYQLYLDALQYDSVDRFNELKVKKWSNRIHDTNSKIFTKQYSRDFHGSFAVTLAFGLLATLFAVKNLVILTGIASMGVVVSGIGLMWLFDQYPEKEYEIF